MATINLGRIKPVWQGVWTGSTAYVKDDIVRYGVDSYICTTAHTSDASTFTNDSANWELMAQGSDIPAQSGQSGKVLKTDGSTLSWGEGGKLVQTLRQQTTAHTSSSYNAQQLVNATVVNTHGVNICQISITPQYSDSIIFASASSTCGIGGNSRGYCSLMIGDELLALPSGNGYAADTDNFSCSGSKVAGNTNQTTVYYRMIGGWDGNTMYMGAIQGSQVYGNPITGTLTVMELRP